MALIWSQFPFFSHLVHKQPVRTVTFTSLNQGVSTSPFFPNQNCPHWSGPHFWSEASPVTWFFKSKFKWSLLNTISSIFFKKTTKTFTLCLSINQLHPKPCHMNLKTPTPTSTKSYQSVITSPPPQPEPWWLVINPPLANPCTSSSSPTLLPQTPGWGQVQGCYQRLICSYSYSRKFVILSPATTNIYSKNQKATPHSQVPRPTCSGGDPV